MTDILITGSAVYSGLYEEHDRLEKLIKNCL